MALRHARRLSAHPVPHFVSHVASRRHDEWASPASMGSCVSPRSRPRGAGHVSDLVRIMREDAHARHDRFGIDRASLFVLRGALGPRKAGKELATPNWVEAWRWRDQPHAEPGPRAPAGVPHTLSCAAARRRAAVHDGGWRSDARVALPSERRAVNENSSTRCDDSARLMHDAGRRRQSSTSPRGGGT